MGHSTSLCFPTNRLVSAQAITLRKGWIMNRQEVCSRIQEIGIMPSVRVAEAELALFAAETVYEAGIPVVEITMTVPNAIEVIAQLTQNYPNFVVGAGTVLDDETAARCVDAGARFITSPGLIPEVLDYTLRQNLVAIPGALDRKST